MVSSRLEKISGFRRKKNLLFFRMRPDFSNHIRKKIPFSSPHNSTADMEPIADTPSHPNPPMPKVIAQVVISATNFARDFPNDSGCLMPTMLLHIPLEDGKIKSFVHLDGYCITVADDGSVRIWLGPQGPGSATPPKDVLFPSMTYRPFSASGVIRDGWPTRTSILDFKIESSHRVHVGARMSGHAGWLWKMVFSSGVFALFDQERDKKSQVVRFASLGREHGIRPNMMTSYPRWEDLNPVDHGEQDYCRFCFDKRGRVKLYKRQWGHMRQPDWICERCLPLPSAAAPAAAPAAPRAVKKRKRDLP